MDKLVSKRMFKLKEKTNQLVFSYNFMYTFMNYLFAF